MPSDDFNKAAEDVKNLTRKPSDEEMLKVYALFKQVTVGDCNTKKPGMFDFKGQAKWDAWNGVTGKDTGTAETEYVDLVKDLKERFA